MDRYIALIRNLRRGDDIESSRKEFLDWFRYHVKDYSKINLRWLISISDTIIDHGNEDEKPRAMMISIFANMVKLSDTNLMNYEYKGSHLTDYIEELYDGLNSFRLPDGDMMNNMFYRIDKILSPTPQLRMLFMEIRNRMATGSETLTMMSKHHNDMFSESFFKGRRSFECAGNTR